ncbi:hypothetical protein FRB96_007254 [Tulasnella sp. 330]|nr:hypothetical protein FRB96_007254 [Tulasnella sp. 330]KAG8873784.1 hypothetical protein FRB97_006434 [Tulasnella sp. 331]
MVTIIKNIPSKPAKDTPLQSIEMPGTKEPGQTGKYFTSHYRNARWTDLKGQYDGLTLCDVFESGLAQAADRPCLGHREVISVEPLKYAPEYTWQTYTEVDRRRRALGSGINNLFNNGRLPTAQDFQGVGIWATNRPEWQITDLACVAYNKVTVALYDTLGPHAVEYVINHSEISIVFSSSNHIADLIKSAENCPSLKMIVSFDPLDQKVKASFKEMASQRGVEVLEMKEVEAEGRKNPVQPIKPTLDQLAAVSYTSGTTGDPKGVMLTHGNLVCGMRSHLHGLTVLPQNFILISYLPLAHIYGRFLELLTLGLGGCIGYFTGNPLNLMADMQVLKPHFFASVPRVLNRIYANLQAAASAPGLKGALFRQAASTKLANFQATGSTTHMFWDALVFKKAQAVLGGRVMFIASASAPIRPEVMDFLKIAFACEVMEGYGLTETCASGHRTLADDPKASGTIGGVTMINECKLVDVTDLSYLSSDKPNPRGELCVRGPNIFTRYYKDDKKTREAIDEEGWFHTGDVAEIDSAGRFKIIDRVKNIMKLSQGEYVALEKVENVYSTCSVIGQIFIYGDSLKDHLVAVVVPEPKVLSDIAAKAGSEFDPSAVPAMAAAIKEPAVKKGVLDVMTAHAKQMGLKGFETVRALHLSLEQFSVENDTMTPTFKIKRKEAYNKYKAPIDAMYAN